MSTRFVGLRSACPCGSRRRYGACCFRWEALGFVLVVLSGLLLPVRWGIRVLWGIVAGVAIIHISRRLWSRRERPRSGTAEPSAPPNGGPATQLGNSGVTEGPPSVS